MAASSQTRAARHSNSGRDTELDGFGCDFLIKLGGSAITVKDRLETLNKDMFTKAIADVARVVALGSFGHFQAKEFDVASGAHHERHAFGLATTRASVCKLNHTVVAALVERSIPAIGVSPCGSWSTAGRGVVERHDSAHLRELLRHKCVPVIHGDVVMDSVQGASVLGGDLLMSILSTTLRPRRVIFVSDVDGVYTCPPHLPGATLIHHVPVSPTKPVDSILASLEVPTAEHDVTGGLQAKIESAVGIVLGTAFPTSRKPHQRARHCASLCSVVACASDGLVAICGARSTSEVMAVHGTHFFEEMDSDDTAAAGEDDSAGHVGVQPPPVPAPGASGMTNKTAATAVATSASPAAAAPAAVPPAAPAAAPVHTAVATATGSPTTTASAHVDTSSVQRVNVMDQILPWLWLGSVFAANNKQLLEEHGITHVVNMAGNVRCKFKKTLTYFHAKDLRDDPTVDLFVPVGDAVEFMLRARDAGHRVLVHCLAGVSRSASTVVAFLMAINGMNLAPALELVQTKRPRANPNRGFHSQLKEMERALVAARENSTPWRRAIAELHNPERVKEQTARRLGDAVKVVHRYRKLRVPEDSIRLAVKKMGLTWTDVEALL